MSDCPYVFQCPDYIDQCYSYGPNGGVGAVYYRYDPCNCGRPFAGCFAGIYWPDVLPWLVTGLILGLLPFIVFRFHLWRIKK